MNKAIIGKKLAMSQIFAPDGTVIPVTIVQAGPCPVVQKKTLDNDGYEAIQIAFGEIKERNVTKPIRVTTRRQALRREEYFASLRQTWQAMSLDRNSNAINSQ